MRFSSLVFVKEDTIIYKGISYRTYELRRNKVLPKNLNIVILDEDIYVKNISYIQSKIDENFIENIIQTEFGLNQDYLFDYNVKNKQKIVNIFAIKGGKIISEISKDKERIRVLPFQIYIIKKLQKKIRKKCWNLVMEFMESYYYISCANNKLLSGYVYNEVDILKNNIKDLGINQLYVDKSIIAKFRDLKNVLEINIGESR